MSLAQLRLASQPMRQRILSLLEEGTGLSSKKVSGMCREMLKLKDALFTFIDSERVDPTNNAAERAIRFAVLLRKGCFGSDSAKGSRFIERFLTARATLRSQRRDLYPHVQTLSIAWVPWDLGIVGIKHLLGHVDLLEPAIQPAADGRGWRWRLKLSRRASRPRRSMWRLSIPSPPMSWHGAG